MATILYPTRGGDSTHRNQDRAVALAKERHAQLLFLYVSNISFLDRVAAPVDLDLVREELDELGEFLLAMAQERAAKNGIAAGAVVRHGTFQEVLLEVIEEYDVTTVLLGMPSQKTAITTQEYIDNLATRLRTATGVEVLILDQGTTIYQND